MTDAIAYITVNGGERFLNVLLPHEQPAYFREFHLTESAAARLCSELAATWRPKDGLAPNT